MATLVFVLIGALLLSGFTNLFTYKYGYGEEQLRPRAEDIKTFPEDGVDVLYIGPSKIMAGIVPSLVWEETGYTGYNLASSNQPVIGSYYLIQQALRSIKPKTIVMEFRYLNDIWSPDDNETWYRHVESALALDPDLQEAYLDSIDQMFPGNQYTEKENRFYKYHNRWKSLGKEDFILDEMPRHYLGARFEDEIHPQNWEHRKTLFYDDDQGINANSLKVYDMIVELCEENGINLIVIIPPTADVTEQEYNRILNTKEYTKRKGITFINYNSPERIKGIGLDPSVDFYDGKHLNINGNYKFTKYFSQDLLNLDIPSYEGKSEKLKNRFDSYYDLYLEDLKNSDTFYLDLPEEE